MTSVSQASKNYKPTWAATIAAEEILPLHRSHFPLWTFLVTKCRFLGNSRPEKLWEKDYFCMFDLFHVLLKPKIIKHLQFHHQAYCCEVYPYLKAMAFLARKLNTAEGKPVAEAVSKCPWLLLHWYKQHISRPKEIIACFLPGKLCKRSMQKGAQCCSLMSKWHPAGLFQQLFFAVPHTENKDLVLCNTIQTYTINAMLWWQKCWACNTDAACSAVSFLAFPISSLPNMFPAMQQLLVINQKILVGHKLKIPEFYWVETRWHSLAG